MNDLSQMCGFKKIEIQEIKNENLIIDKTADVMTLENYDTDVSDMDDDLNDTLEEAFIYELDKTWDTGNIKYAQNAIINYKGLVSNEYIKKAENTINELLIEKIDDLDMTCMDLS